VIAASPEGVAAQNRVRRRASGGVNSPFGLRHEFVGGGQFSCELHPVGGEESRAGKTKIHDSTLHDKPHFQMGHGTFAPIAKVALTLNFC